ncbi:hypothetical protein TanjilG_07578 [Lupinus angustifolius]|uniref:Serine/threonine-protein kinase TOR n=1 Tax=Lupinus angustifolius TaxID=3871 RepID=A0A1J7FWW1_LUPAN|nr:hypothetical protein TanjilG_07578 [Lupinus angustifolius]
MSTASHRHTLPPSAATNVDTLNRILSDLCTRPNPKEGASPSLKKHIEEQARDLSGDAFSRFMDQLYDRISTLLDNTDVTDILGALRAIDELIDVSLGENASKVSRISTYMRNVFDAKRDPDVLLHASKVLGHLARAGGAMNAEEVERQVQIALDWLRGTRLEYRRFAAVLILKEMAENASTVFNVHVPEFVDAIWVALRDPALPVRERAVEALRACLRVIEKRETRWRVQWYYRMFEATQDGLGKNAPVHSIHGSLLAVGELLRNTGEFMMSRYREVAEIVLRYLEHRDRLVRLSITSLLPRIAHFLRDRFVTNYLTICMNHILSVLKVPQDRDSGFIALGEMAGALDGELIHYLPTITTHLRDAIAPRRSKPSLEALACIGSIAKAMGPAMEPHVRGLLDIMFSTGLSTVLVEALEQICTSIPSLLPTIQDRLLDSISMVLLKSHYHLGRLATSMGRGTTTNASQQFSELSGSALVQLALQTLARFNFKGHDLLEFVRESVVLYLDDEDGATRKDAALCCCKIVSNSFSGILCAHFGSSRLNRSGGGKRRRLVEELVEKILISAVADADVTVRHSIFTLYLWKLLSKYVQDRLLDSISMVLLKSHYHLGRLATSMGRGTTTNASQQFSELSGSALVQLALQTLARFNFKGHDLLEFVRESVVLYLDDEDGATRKDAALCCCKIVSNSFSGILCAHFGSSRLNRSGGGKRRRLVEELVEKILISAVADADVTVRHSIFTSLHGDRGFDEYLAQADNLSAVFAALNDEDFDVREYAISVAGRLSEKNPAYVLPALRRHLIQLLTYLEQSADSKCKEESAKLLGCLIRNCERLILPYIAPVHKALVARLNDVNANTGIVSGVLVTVGDLARVGGFAMRQYIPELMPLIVEALLDGAAVSKREVAVATLGQVVQSTGYVITPYNEYPLLLVLLLKLLNGELVWSTRREVLKVLGIMGALDPHMHKRNQKALPGPHGEITRPASDSNQQIQTMDEFPADLWPSFASSDDYYSTVAINSLMRILRDPSLGIYHLKVIGSLMFIFKSMGLGCVPYLPKVLPDLFHTVRACDENVKDFITWKLGTLVSIVRQHIRKYLQDLLSLISEFWSAFTLPAQNRPPRGYPVLHLVEQLCLALNDEFRTYLPIILPGCIQVISDAERCNNYTYVLDILHTLEVFGGTLDEHMHLLLPALIRLFKVDASVDIRRAAIKTLTRLIPCVQVTGHISSLVHHLKLVLDGKNDELRTDAIDALCCLAHALGEDFTIFIPSIHKLLLKYRLRHKEFEEIEGRLQRHEPLILGTTASQRLNRRLPVEVISDPLKDSENDPYEDGSDAHKLRGHQVNDGRLRTAGEASQRRTLDEHMHLLLPALIRLFKVDASVDIRRAAIKTLTRLIPCVQVTGHISSLVHHLKLVLDGKNDELRTDAIDALCCLAHALGEDFTIFIPSIHKLLLKYRLRHKEFEEIEGRLQRHEPLILGTTASQRLNRRLPVEVISDPLKDSENDPYEDGSDAHKLRGHQVNDGRLRTAGEASQRSTKEDWAEWMRHFSIQLLKESPSPALRTCARLAQLQPFVGRELFAAGFVSCWAQLNETSQKQLVRNLEMAFSSPNIPPEILATLLNLAEFMEHDEKPLPIDIRLLGALAEKCRAFAKALHYKEMEFEGARSKKMDANPVAVVEALIHINNQLHQHEAADGILTYAQQHLDFQLKESWYEKLQRWDDALMAYTAKASQATSPHLVLDATLGRMRCLASLARWEELNNLCKEYWTPAEPAARLEMASMAANAAWNMGEWDQMAEYVSRLDDGDETKLRGLGNTASGGDGSSNGTFFRAVLLVRIGKYDEAREYVERARKCLATELAALVLESYERAYSNMVRVQQLSELEEVIDYRTLPIGDQVAEERRALIRNMWTQRIQGVKSNVEVWQALLAVRALVLPPVEDIETWLKFASLCRKNGRISQARSTLVKLLQYDPEISPENVRYHGPPQVMLAYLKYQWSLGEDSKRTEAFIRLQNLAMELSSAPNIQPVTSSGFTNGLNPCVPLLARVNLILGSWQWSLSPGLDDESIKDILDAFANATQYSNKWAKAWHKWALFNTAVMSHYTLRGFPDVAAQFVVAAVTGYFHSIACAANAKGVDDSLQDILRLLTLWFNHGATAEVQMALKKGFSLVNINTWLVVLPQIIARIHSNNHAVRELIQSLLVRIGQNHPQALMYPLLVACKSISNLRKAAAQEVVDKVRQRSGVLVDQAQLVSKELIRVAILWHETWHEALEEASRLYFGEHNIEGMLKVLEPLHEMLEEGAMRNNVTIKERIFIEAYRQELLEAYECCVNYKRTGKDAELTQAWDIYYHVFRKIDKQLQSLTTLDLESVSPELLECRNLELAVPGTYRADAPVVTIASFARQLVVITSKQRPRKLTIHGSDGDDYAFLLKGHEDLRQDERVMQLFGLVNTLLENSRKTAEKDLSIERYAVIPLSPNSGLIEWVPNCDTLHHLIREYRDARKITLNQEHKCMLSFAPDYDHLPLIAKVEVFEFALDNTEGNDLARVLWLKSRTSEIWLERRTNYTRSLAVMSMVGYLLGLGDRHPSNLMLHRFSGKILHIDFGDCFEASMNREKFPEKVPFRLTRMLEKAMEVSGIEGNFRSTCENVMQVLRTNKDSVMAMMEAFVHDPLINWRLFNFNEVPQMSMLTSNHVTPAVNTEESAQNREFPHPQRGARERELLQAVNQLGDANEVLNERAVVVMARMSNKLTGRDFSTSSVPNSSLQHAVDHSSLVSGDTREVDHALSVKLQVQKLIVQATSHENLCQNYVGWCPFW